MKKMYAFFRIVLRQGENRTFFFLFVHKRRGFAQYFLFFLHLCVVKSKKSRFFATANQKLILFTNLKQQNYVRSCR